jgi:hypothetical protein
MVSYVSPEDLALLPVLIAYTTWWAYDLRKGSRVRRATLALHLVVYGLAAFYVWAVSLGEIVRAGAASSSLVWLWTIQLTVVVIVAAEVGQWYGAQRLVVEVTPAGRWRYRGPVRIAAFWLALYLTRFGLEDGLLGGFSVFLPSARAPAGVPLDTFVAVVLVVASLYLVSFGFMFGITQAVWERARQERRTAAGFGKASPSAPSPAGDPSSRVSTAPDPASTTGPEAGTGSREPVVAAAASPPPAGPSSSGPPGAPPSARICPDCGKPTRPTGAFCGECGHRLPAPA